MRKIYLFAILMMAISFSVKADYCTLTSTTSSSGRGLTSVTLNETVVAVNQGTSGTRDVYYDLTATSVEVEAGSEVAVSASWTGEWLHGYLYIDYNSDEVFTPVLNSDNSAADDSELVSFTYYDPNDAGGGVNSLGESTLESSRLDAVPSFTIPADLAAGTYRARFNIDWCCIDPCGTSDIATNQGAIVDFTIEITSSSEPVQSYTVSVATGDETMGTVTVNGEASALIEEGATATFVAIPAAGYAFVNWTDADGIGVSTEATYETTVLAAISLTANFEVASATPTAPASYLTFNGDNQYVDIPITDAFKMSAEQDLSFSLWAKVENPAVFPRLFGNRLNATKDGSLDVFVGANGYGVMFVSQDGTDPVNAYVGGESYVWVHISAVFSREEGMARVYVDGEQTTTGALSETDLLVQTVSTTLGSCLNSYGELDFFLNGSIGNLRFYRGALTAAQVAEDMAANSYADLSTDLKDICTVAYDLTNILRSTTLVDATGNGNDGTYVNFDDNIVAEERTITVASADVTMGTVTGGGTAEGKILCTAIANDGYVFECWKDENDNVVSTDVEYYENTAGDKTVTAYFLTAYTVTVSTDGNGTISPEGDVAVGVGLSKTFTINANDSYKLETLLLDGVDVTANVVDDTYTIEDIAGNHTLEATFVALCNPDGFNTPFVETFDSAESLACWTIVNANGDAKEWYFNNAGCMAYAYSSTLAADDWLISPKINVSGEACFSIDYRAYQSYYPEKFSVYVMDSPSNYENATEIQSTIEVSNTTYQTLTVDMSAYDGQSVYVGIYCESIAFQYYLYVDNFKVAIPTFTASASIVGQGSVTVNGEENSTEAEKDSDVIYVAAPDDNYEFESWTDAEGNVLGTDATYTLEGISAATTITATFVLQNARTVSVAINNNAAGTVSITSPETDATSISTKYEVAVTTNGVENAYFLNWTDAEGNIISETETFTYNGVTDIALTANYEFRFPVAIETNAGGDMVIKLEDETVVTDGTILVEGTSVFVTVVPNENKQLFELLINNVNKAAEYVDGYEVVISGETTIESSFEYINSRTITVYINDSSLGSVSITSPTTTVTSITTKEPVTVKAEVAEGLASDCFFMGWTDQQGNIVSEVEEFTYDDAADLTITANYEARYVVTISNSTGGEISVKDEDGASVLSGSRVIAGTNVTISLTPQSGRVVESLTLNDVDLLPYYTDELGCTLEITATSNIYASFKYPQVAVTYETEGAGYIEISDSYDVVQNQVANGDNVSYGSPYYIYAYTYNGGELQTITVNGESVDPTNGEDYVQQITNYGNAEFYAYGDQHVEVVFSGTSTGIEDATAATAAVYGVAGAVVIDAEDAVATIYSLAGAAVKTVAVAGKTTVAMAQGVYIVSIDGASYKAVVK